MSNTTTQLPSTMSQNMYRVGGKSHGSSCVSYASVSDYVYFEVFPSSPYQIRRIEELNKVRLRR